MAGYFFSACLWSRSINTQKAERRGQCPGILTKQSWSVKDLLYGVKHPKMIFEFLGPNEKFQAGKLAPSCPLGLPISRDWIHLARSRI